MLFGKHINKYYWFYLGYILIGLVALLAVDYFQLQIPEVYRDIVNGIGSSPKVNLSVELPHLMLKMFTIMVIMVVGRFIWRICFFGAGIKVETSLRQEMFEHCKKLSQEYYSNNKVGSLMALFTNDIETIQECFGWGILMFFDVFCLGGYSLIKMFLMDPILSLLLLIPLGIMVAISIIVGKTMEKKWDERQEAFSRISDFAQESFSGIAIIKAFVKETKELLAFRKLNKENEDANIEFVKASTILNILIELLIHTITAIILGYGGYLVISKKFDVGQLLEFFSYFNSVVWPMMAISELIGMTSRGKSSLKRINELLDYKVEITDRENAINLENIKGKIVFNNLTFRYPGTDVDVLKNVSFTINPGESVGIIGKTGCGKSTIVDLLLRTYNVDDGTIFVDDYDVNSITIQSLRQAIAYVPQDNFLFSETIESNIGFAYETADEGLIEDVSKIANVHQDIIAFADGYHTVLGERGVTVSGGQKQRISIARALAKKASILILDDSVSAVDTKTETSILHSLQEERKGMTTILIAHRVTTIEKMNKILFMGDGCVIDFGTHHELLYRCPEYAKMVALQRLEDEKGGNA